LAGPNQIGTPGEANNLLRGAQKLCPTHFSREPPAPLLVTGLIIGNDFFVFRKSPLTSTLFLPPYPADVPASLLSRCLTCQNVWVQH